MKKREAILFSLAVITILLASSVYADTNVSTSSDPFAASYSCLKSQIDATTYANMNVEQLATSLLALGYDSTRQSALVSELEKRKSANSCWPNGACTLKRRRRGRSGFSARSSPSSSAGASSAAAPDAHASA